MEREIEKKIGKIIYNKIPIEWMKYNMFSVNDIYKNVPMLVFRYDDKCPIELRQKLINAVLTFNGREKWNVFRHPATRKENYILSIEQMESALKKIYDNKYSCSIVNIIGPETYKKYCENAVKDISQLAIYINDYLQ